MLGTFPDELVAVFDVADLDTRAYVLLEVALFDDIKLLELAFELLEDELEVASGVELTASDDSATELGLPGLAGGGVVVSSDEAPPQPVNINEETTSNKVLV